MRTLVLQLSAPGSRRASQRGFVLIAALAVLVILTMLAVSMFRGLGLEERITGNSREKQHAFFAAQSALQNAETWLNGGNAGVGGACPTSSPVPSAEICNSATTPSQQTLATTDWNCTFGTAYAVAQLVPAHNCSGALSASSPTVYMNPQFTISYLGPDPAGSGGYLYQITSLGYGGNQNAVAVVQSVYSVGNGGAQQKNK
jgi:type IV pilus assembly protein PilX